jgi:hypothetical protein
VYSSAGSRFFRSQLGMEICVPTVRTVPSVIFQEVGADGRIVASAVCVRADRSQNPLPTSAFRRSPRLFWLGRKWL